MDQSRLKELISQKKKLDEEGGALMLQAQQWKDEMLSVVGLRFYDAQKGFLWDLICYEVLEG